MKYFIAFLFCECFELTYFYEAMLKILSKEQWTREVLKVRPLQLTEKSIFIDAFTNLTALKPVFYLYQQKDQTLISYIAFVRNGCIDHPFYFFYSSFWIADHLSDAKYAACLTEFVKQLTQLHRKILIKLPTEIEDLRPFQWNHFAIKHHYTYVKELSSLNYHETTRKNIRKCQKAGYVCRVEDLNHDTLHLNLGILKELNFFGKAKVNSIGELLMIAGRAGSVKCFNCYRDDRLVASNIILMDEEYKIAYTLLLNKIERTIKDDVHSLLHDFFFKELKLMGYEKVDLLGADLPTIAEFKSRFNAKLVPHFVVSYSQSQATVNKRIAKAKAILKKFIYKH